VSASGFLAAIASGIPAFFLSGVMWMGQEKPAGDSENRLTPSKKNAAAEDLESLVLALGLDPNRGDPSAEHPSKEDVDAYQRAAIGSWLDDQLRSSDDSIAAPPPAVRTFLEKRQPTVWRVAELLERDVPQWDWEAVRNSGQPLPAGILAPALSKILIAASLIEERSGRHAQAGNLLEAAWSLSGAFRDRLDAMAQIIAVHIGRLLAGALRKMSEPPVQWLDRMSGLEPWRVGLEALEAKHIEPFQASDAAEEELRKPITRAWRAVADRLRKLSPCEASKLPDEEIWRPATEEIARSIEAGADPGLKTLLEIARPNETEAIRRTARLLLDREVTARVLEIRQEKAASREGRWPERFSDLESRVCPEASYEYQTRGSAMAIRFKGLVDDGGSSPLVLPLSFEVRAPRQTSSPTPVRPHRPAVTPRPRA
jgi:hypothetical protein